MDDDDDMNDIGIYSNDSAVGEDRPYQLLASTPRTAIGSQCNSSLLSVVILSSSPSYVYLLLLLLLHPLQ